MAKLRGTPVQIASARGDERADMLLQGGEIFSTTTREWIKQDLAVKNGAIVGWGHRDAETVVDVSGCRLTPGFIDAHMHLESTKLWIGEFVRAVLARGTTAVAADPHEIGNVFGTRGILALAEATKNLPFTFGICASSCVPASPFESPGSEISAFDIEQLMRDESVIGVAEMMNYPGVIAGDPDVLAKITAGGSKRVDGHAPGVIGSALDAYLTAGIESDHECSTLSEAHEKRRKGMWVFLRQGSAAQNIATLAPSVIEFGTSRTALCSDDREPGLLKERGHINDCVREAVRSGITVEDAIVMATLNAADYHGFGHLGSLAPGFQADILVFRQLENFEPDQVYQRGILVAQHGRIIDNLVETSDAPSWMFDSIHLRSQATGEDFNTDIDLSLPSRIIQISPGTILTKELIAVPAKAKKGEVASLAVIERHKATGRRGVGLVSGFGLHQGAIASTVAHDAHNIMVVGALGLEGREDMALAVNTLCEIGGGQVVCLNKKVLATVPLPIAGLMTTAKIDEVAELMELALSSARFLGVTAIEPFMNLSFLGLSVIPELRLTDLGLIDTTKFELTTITV